MKKSRTFLTVLTAIWFAGAASAPAFGEVTFYDYEKNGDSEYYSEDKDTERDLSSAITMVKKLLESGTMTAEEIKDLGPGYRKALEAYDTWAEENHQVGSKGKLEEEKDSEFSGPVVTKVTLGQVYHEDYKTYEFSMANEYFFYANVGNGNLTNEPVKIDIPTNLTYTVEKDGIPYAYESRQLISAKGTYVVKLMAVENQEAPLSEQKEYQAVFRFRIQEKPPTEEEIEEEAKKLSEKVSDIKKDFDFKSESEAEKEVDELDLETEEETEPEAASEIESETEKETELETETESAEKSYALAERSQSFDAASGNYIITLENGKELTASVPEGYVGSAPVSLHVSEDDAVDAALYKDDALVEFINDASVNEYGHYRVELGDCSYFFTLAEAVKQMEYYPAPAGMKFTEAYFGEEALALASERYAELGEDGRYTFVMSGEAGERLEVSLKKDTTAPEMNVALSKNSAAIEYLSDDIKTIRLVKDGKEVAGFGGTSITEPGKYTLTISDAAGNSTSSSFSLSYQVNMYGIFAVLLIILVIVGIVVFTIYIKKHTKVR